MVDFGSHYILPLQYLFGNQHILQAVLIGGFDITQVFGGSEMSWHNTFLWLDKCNHENMKPHQPLHCTDYTPNHSKSKATFEKKTSHITWSFLNNTHTNQAFLQLILTPISPKSRALVRTSIPNPPAWRAKWLQGNHPNLPIPLHTLPHKEGYQETN